MPWLLKTEPDVFSFSDLLAAPACTTLWEGVRNYQARNFMRAVRVGDAALVYHSSTKPTGVAGLAEVVREAYPDPTQFDEQSPYYDAKASRDAPRWDAVNVRGVAALPRFVPLAELRTEPELQSLKILQRGNRLSVTPLTEREFRVILRLGRYPTKQHRDPEDR